MATTYVDALVMQHPDVERQIKKLCALLAGFKLKDNDKTDLAQIFKDNLEKAMKRSDRKGNKRAYRHVQYSAAGK